MKNHEIVTTVGLNIALKNPNSEIANETEIKHSNLLQNFYSIPSSIISLSPPLPFTTKKYPFGDERPSLEKKQKLQKMIVTERRIILTSETCFFVYLKGIFIIVQNI